jgi:hypothetical protein
MFCLQEEKLKSQNSSKCEKVRKTEFSKNDDFMLEISCVAREKAYRQLLAFKKQVRCAGKENDIFLLLTTFHNFALIQGSYLFFNKYKVH